MPTLLGFPPIVNKHSKVVVLGSMPSVESIRIQQYYGHPRNQFWEMMKRLLKQNTIESYADKKKMVLEHGIALWDVVGSCQRTGSLDVNLREIQVNDFPCFLKKYPQIRAIFCNGQKSYRLFKGHYANIILPVFALPSTSPAHTMPLDRKLIHWKKILPFLD